MALTRRQHQVLEVIRSFLDRHGYSPSLEEIGRELNLSSVATVHKHVSHLVQKGYVKRAWNQNRSIELVDGPRRGAYTLPLSGSIAAGQPLEAVESIETIDVPADMVRDPERHFVLRVRGESMIDEQIRDGDFVIVERREVADSGQTVVAVIDDSEATLKRFRPEGSRVRLEPANSRIEPIIVPADRVQIRGVVVGVIRKY